MFDVLVYLYENYWRPDACPEHDQLTRKLSSVGFESEEIEEALSWLDGVATAAQSYVGEQAAQSLRVYSGAELEHLGESSVGFISFLESAGVLPPPMREMVIDRASAIPGGPLDVEVGLNGNHRSASVLGILPGEPRNEELRLARGKAAAFRRLERRVSQNGGRNKCQPIDRTQGPPFLSLG